MQNNRAWGGSSYERERIRNLTPQLKTPPFAGGFYRWSEGFEKVASYSVRIATTCTEHVMFKSRLVTPPIPQCVLLTQNPIYLNL